MSYRLRRVREADLETIRHWRMLPEVTRYMYTDPQLTREDQQAWFSRISRSERDQVWVIESLGDDGNGHPLGLLSLSEIDLVNRRCNWAYYLGDVNARGTGLAKPLELSICAYVFEQLGLNKLCCEVLASNDRVVALHEKFGARVEGVLRQHICKNGEYLDVVRMGLLRADWAVLRDQWTYTPVLIESPPGHAKAA